jgi:hypothetical protein
MLGATERPLAEKETAFMVRRRITLSLALVAGAAAAPVAAQAQAAAPPPSAHMAGSDAPAINPAVVGVPIARTDKALSAAADFIDQANGALAAKPLTAARRYLIRSYSGARYLIALPPPAPPAEDARAQAVKFKRLARRVVRAAHRGGDAKSAWVQAHAADDGPAGPAFADTPTAVFNVLTSQYAAATDAAGMYPDTTGTLQSKVKLVLDSAIILRNRLVKAIAAAEPPAPAEEGRVHAHASQEEGETPTFAPLMPGLTVLLDDEIQQLKATLPLVPAAAAADLQAAITADGQIETLVNSTWPPAPAD